MIRKILFTVELQGEGKTIEEAWMDAVESFSLDPGPPPEEHEEVKY